LAGTWVCNGFRTSTTHESDIKISRLASIVSSVESLGDTSGGDVLRAPCCLFLLAIPWGTGDSLQGKSTVTAWGLVNLLYNSAALCSIVAAVPTAFAILWRSSPVSVVIRVLPAVATDFNADLSS
jgi:hypothetical protein